MRKETCFIYEKTMRLKQQKNDTENIRKHSQNKNNTTTFATNNTNKQVSTNDQFENK